MFALELAVLIRFLCGDIRPAVHTSHW